MDKVKDDIDKALFYVHQTVENGWSRSMLLNFISTDLYERQGKALTNFTKTLPDAMSDLAQGQVLNQYKKYGPADPLHYISMPKPRIQWGH